MIVAWMLYGLLVSVLLGAAAAVLAQGCRMLRLPSRFVWLAALVSTAALIALAPGREAPPTIMVAEIGLGDAAAVPTLRRSGPLPFATRAAAAARALVADGLRTAAGAGADAGTAVAGVWLLASGLLLVAALTTMGRAWLLRRGWDEREVAGVPVRVAPLAGPAVLGVIRPEVVIPRWLLDRPPLEQRVVVLHEQEHVRGGDPLVLAVGCLTAVLLPWNPLAWWMLLRLRLAVEMDCDHRVLRRGVPTAAYGSLLIHMAGRSPGLTLGVPALSGSPSTLERRIRAMTERSPRFAPLRAAALATLALGALVAACDTRMPTSAEIENMDVTSAEAHARQMQLAAGDIDYYVDGRQVTAAEAHALAADQIVQMDVKRNQGERSVVNITTYTASRTADGASTPSASSTGPHRIFVRSMGTAGESGTAVTSVDHFEGLVVIDGVISSPSAMRSLRPDRIVNVEVIKGAAASRAYDDPRAANGVIRITTGTQRSQPR